MRYVGIRLYTPHGELSKKMYTYKVIGTEDYVRNSDLVVVSTRNGGFALGMIDTQNPNMMVNVDEVVIMSLGNICDVYRDSQRLKNTDIKEKVLKKIDEMDMDELIELYKKME